MKLTHVKAMVVDSRNKCEQYAKNYEIRGTDFWMDNLVGALEELNVARTAQAIIEVKILICKRP